MSELDNLLRQKAEIEARIEQVKAEEVEKLKLKFVETATQLRELNSLPKHVVDVFTDKAGTFNVYRTLRVKKP